MKIVRIFADHLFAFQYENEVDNEYDRLMEFWTNVAWLSDFARKNQVTNVIKFIENILKDAEQIQDFLENLNQFNHSYGFYFEPLQDSERTKILALQKGKIIRNQLRYYAIKLDDNCFVITGGAIKMSQKMVEHPDTANELIKLKHARAFLNKNGVFDEDSFYELLSEQS
jgi:hypothetical protein